MHRCSSHSEVTLSKEFLAAVLAAILFGLPLRHWVNTDRQQSSSVKVAPASFGERHIRILAQRHQLLFAIYAVLPALELTAGRRHPEEQGSVVTQLVDGAAGLLNLHIR